MVDAEEDAAELGPEPRHEARERVCPMCGGTFESAWAGHRIGAVRDRSEDQLFLVVDRRLGTPSPPFVDSLSRVGAAAPYSPFRPPRLS